MQGQAIHPDLECHADMAVAPTGSAPGELIRQFRLWTLTLSPSLLCPCTFRSAHTHTRSAGWAGRMHLCLESPPCASQRQAATLGQWGGGGSVGSYPGQLL